MSFMRTGNHGTDLKNVSIKIFALLKWNLTPFLSNLLVKISENIIFLRLFLFYITLTPYFAFHVQNRALEHAQLDP